MHKNNFDFLRLIFATLVMVTHSFVLSGSPDNDWLGQITGGQINLSSVGVKGFFIISGFLIFQSIFRSRNWGDYMMRRVLRIYPAYIVVMLFAVVLCFFLSGMGAGRYFADPSVSHYLGNNLAMFLPLQYQIADVFGTNPYKHAINGSIWTIPYEFLFYIILSTAFLLKGKPRLLTVLLIAAYCILFLLTVYYENAPDFYFPKDTFELHQMAHFALFFFGGATLAAVHIGDWRHKHILLITSCLLCIATLLIKTFYFPQFLLLPIVVIVAGTYATKGIAGLNKQIGDLSYGIYLYGFIVQQVLEHFFRLNYWQLMLTSIPITYIFGTLSWYLIEKRALSLKRFFP